ncbi:hypothetical protein HF521_022765 [Silurus meridionalis]|uniref:Sushi domain-containing protein n=1 Tax=Silurus meridionalis TaxID=175797 RepID=A0A8T0B9Z9_SILME|nr:hypothetical protein HF521_022765 [Silurus meridionalis]
MFITVVETLRCPNPEQEINNAIMKRIHLKAYYLEGATIQYKCKAGYNFKNGPQATCFRGKWDYPQCIMFVENVKCPKPERQINNAFLNRAYQRAYYLEGSAVQYKKQAITLKMGLKPHVPQENGITHNVYYWLKTLNVQTLSDK